MQKSFFKILTGILIIGLNWGGISAAGYTLGMFNDTENAAANLFEAGIVDFSLDVYKPDYKNKSYIGLEPGDIAWEGLHVIPEEHSNPFQYYVKADNFSGDEELCNVLDADVELLGVEMYSGDLHNLLTDATTTITMPEWNFEFGIGQNNLQNKICNFDIIYNGWQTRHDYPTYGDEGFSDTEMVSNTISSWGFKLNKIYYDVASDRGEEGDNEWVEIFNQTSVPLDISGWEICDNSSCDILPEADPIPAMGYGVITATSTTWGYWFVPSEVVKFVLDDSKIGNGLGNDGDALYLKRPDGVVVDEMNWQSNTDVWNPAAVDVAEGNLLARVPNGYDTDQESDWTELVPPDIDLIYPDEDGSYTWYWTHSYAIEWTALNPNGDDEKLVIDLYYVKDVNGDSKISDGDTRHEIVKATANDGSYLWEVPKGFIGYIWIELVATGHENPMLNSKTISGDIWDPVPVFLWEEDPQVIIEALANPDDNEGVVIGEEDVSPLDENEDTDEVAGEDESAADSNENEAEDDESDIEENIDDAADIENTEEEENDSEPVVVAVVSGGGGIVQETSGEIEEPGDDQTEAEEEEVKEENDVVDVVEDEEDLDGNTVDESSGNENETDSDVENEEAAAKDNDIDIDEADENDDGDEDDSVTEADEVKISNDEEGESVAVDEVVENAEENSGDEEETDESEDEKIGDNSLLLEPVIEPEPEPEVKDEEDESQDAASDDIEDVSTAEALEEPAILTENDDIPTSDDTPVEE